jgi:hypothetical protein
MQRACLQRMGDAGDAELFSVHSQGIAASRKSAVAAARALISRLVPQDALQHPSFMLEVTHSGSVNIEFQGQHRGEWRWDGEFYVWTPVMSGTSHYTARSPDEAARISLLLLTHLPDEDELHFYREVANDEEL